MDFSPLFVRCNVSRRGQEHQYFTALIKGSSAARLPSPVSFRTAAFGREGEGEGEGCPYQGQSASCVLGVCCCGTPPARALHPSMWRLAAAQRLSSACPSTRDGKRSSLRAPAAPCSRGKAGSSRGTEEESIGPLQTLSELGGETCSGEQAVPPASCPALCLYPLIYLR